MVDGPAVRARSTQDALAYADQFSPGATAKIRELIPPESLRVIDQATRTGWIPVEHDRHVPASTIEVLGEARAVECWREFLRSHLKAPLFRTVIDASIRLFGLSPATLAKITPRIFPLAYKDFCVVRSRAEEDMAELVLDEVHPEVADVAAYPVSFRAFFYGFLDICGVDGTVEVRPEPERDVIRARLHWSPLKR